jgi:hypothetical protein
MHLETCAQCGGNLAPPLKSSGRQVCSYCGWTDKKRVPDTPLSEAQKDESNLVQERDQAPLSDSEQKSGIAQELVRVSNYLLIGILGILLYGQGKKTSYEYDVVSPPDSSFNESMNKYGEQGWHAVSCRRATASGQSESVSYECILVREKRSL